MSGGRTPFEPEALHRNAMAWRGDADFSPTVELPLQQTVLREISLYGSCASCGEYPESLDMIARGDVKVDPLISAVAPLSEGPAWFERLYRQEPGLMKVILTPGGEE